MLAVKATANMGTSLQQLWLPPASHCSLLGPCLSGCICILLINKLPQSLKLLDSAMIHSPHSAASLLTLELAVRHLVRLVHRRHRPLEKDRAGSSRSSCRCAVCSAAQRPRKPSGPNALRTALTGDLVPPLSAALIVKENHLRKAHGVPD